VAKQRRDATVLACEPMAGHVRRAARQTPSCTRSRGSPWSRGRSGARGRTPSRSPSTRRRRAIRRATRGIRPARARFRSSRALPAGPASPVRVLSERAAARAPAGPYERARGGGERSGRPLVVSQGWALGGRGGRILR
jgi:hypothetical protein